VLHSTKNLPYICVVNQKQWLSLINIYIKHRPPIPPGFPGGLWAAKTVSSMNIENTQSQMRKGILEFCILSIIRRGEAYPSDIVEEMRGANLQILEGTLYPLLTRLKNADMLTYRWVESNSGPPRKYFSLTEKGLQFYRELEATWNELANAVNTLATKNEQLANIPANASSNI
jgi:PadR family transcriptional regulator, regulatory protein PadR